LGKRHHRRLQMMFKEGLLN